MIHTDDTHLSPEESKEIDAIMKENTYYNLEDVMTYLRMRDTFKKEITYV